MSTDNTNAIGYQTSSASASLSESAQTCQELPKLAQTYSKTEKHLVEWCEGSGVSEVIARLAVKYLRDRKVIAHHIGWKIYSDDYSLGWFASGLNLTTMQRQAFGQFKPDIAIQFPEEEKPTKYISDKGHPYDAIALPHPEGAKYWQRILDDVSIIVDLDEGTKKAGAGMTCGLPSLALCGVSMWQIKGELVPNLAMLAVPGRTFRIRFDMDVLTKKEVKSEVKKLVKALEARGCNVLVAMWDKELGLKIDDVLVKHGPEMVKKIMSEAQPYPQWLKSLEAQMKEPTASEDAPAKAKKPPTPQDITARLAEEFGHQLKYDEEQQNWRKWDGKSWGKIGLGAFRSWLKNTLDGKGVKYGGSAYLEDVRKLLECDLRQLKWQFWEKSRYINFSNCVFDGAKTKTLKHSPGMGFTSFLPYEYHPLKGDLGDSLEALRINCPKIYQFFHEAMKGDKRKMFKLLAIINALIKHRFFDLQMFVHLVGKPGSGKGKFARLCEKLVGESNYTGCQLERLTDGSTKASIIDKQLVVFPDERKPVGIDSILSLTGGDIISYRELHTPAASAYFYGTIMICSNKPIFVGDTTGLERRLCLVGFDNPIPDDKRDHSLEQELDSEIPACIAIALSLADKAVTQAIRGKGTDQIVEFKRKEWEMKVESDSIAAFFDMALISDPTAETRTGELFEAYTAFCTEGGMSRIKLPKFGGMLADILAGEKLPFTRKQGARASFVGLRLRTDTDTQPTHSEVLAGIVGVCEGVGGGLEGVCEGVKPLLNIELRDLKGFDTKSSAQNANEKDFLPDEEESDREINLPLSTHPTPSNAESVKDTILSPTPSQPSLNPLSTEIEKPLILADEMKNALASADREAARKVWNQVKTDKAAQENLKSQLTQDENINVRLLLNCGFVKGMRVKYIGQKFAEYFEGMELVVDGIDSHHGVCCKKPDGSWTAYLDKSDWQMI